MSENVIPKFAGREFPEIFSILRMRVEDSDTWFNSYTSEAWTFFSELLENNQKELLALLEHDPAIQNVVTDKLDAIIYASESLRSELCDMYFIEGFSAGIKLLREVSDVGRSKKANRRNL